MPSLKPRTSKRRSARRGGLIHKPHGVLQPRVQKVGPEHFGIVCVDCAKVRSRWLLCNFYGTVLVPPTDVAHSKYDFLAMETRLRQALAEHDIQDLVVAIERTGNYHLPVKRALSRANFECRIVHPFATKQLRQPADPGNKTDDTDLAAIFRAASTGFGLLEQPLSPLDEQLRLLVRHRRDLIYKRSALCCQMREHLEATLPGFAACFENLWDSAVGLYLACAFSSPEAIRQAGTEGLAQRLRESKLRFQTPMLGKIATWAGRAAAPHSQAAIHHQILLGLEADRTQKTAHIEALECQLAGLLVQTPYVLLLSFPGIHVVSAAELAGELGPIEHYANARAITGRSGLYPARYQSDQVDRDGALIRCANRRLRAALLMVADNLAKCNPHFHALAAIWKTNRKDPRRTRIKIASRFSRIAYQMVAGRQVCRHPAIRQRSLILDKLLQFHREHATPPAQTTRDLQAAIEHLPVSERAVEAVPLAQQLEQTRTARRRGPQPLADVLPLVLAKLGAGALQLSPSGDRDPS